MLLLVVAASWSQDFEENLTVSDKVVPPVQKVVNYNKKGKDKKANIFSDWITDMHMPKWKSQEIFLGDMISQLYPFYAE